MPRATHPPPQEQGGLGGSADGCGLVTAHCPPLIHRTRGTRRRRRSWGGPNARAGFLAGVIGRRMRILLVLSWPKTPNSKPRRTLLLRACGACSQKNFLTVGRCRFGADGLCGKAAGGSCQLDETRTLSPVTYISDGVEGIAAFGQRSA
jgi:hypothetical protein